MGGREQSGDPDAQSLSIGELARRTGLTPQVLRAWETRFGFPVARRDSSGRRQYDPGDVARVTRVLALKDAGWRLAQAIEHVAQQVEADGRDLSVYGELRRQLPQLETRRFRRDVLVSISRAIEDEALARAVRPLIFGAFQRERFYRRSAHRWEELARTAQECVVFADFGRAVGAAGRPVRVSLSADAPLLREWVVVVRSQDFSIALSAWEIPADPAAADRWYETIVTFEPEAVRIAVDTFVAAARSVDAPVETIRDHPTGVTLAPARTPSPGVDALILRAFTYLQDASNP